MAAESAISWLARQTLDGVWHQGHTLNPWMLDGRTWDELPEAPRG